MLAQAVTVKAVPSKHSLSSVVLVTQAESSRGLGRHVMRFIRDRVRARGACRTCARAVHDAGTGVSVA